MLSSRYYTKSRIKKFFSSHQNAKWSPSRVWCYYVWALRKAV
uniref:Uncharacterized protein n=1 Tax=Arundo donax TaxID=35708 RepID=A0A0A8ZK65_ARUDO